MLHNAMFSKGSYVSEQLLEGRYLFDISLNEVIGSMYVMDYTTWELSLMVEWMSSLCICLDITFTVRNSFNRTKYLSKILVFYKFIICFYLLEYVVILMSSKSAQTLQFKLYI